MFELKILDEQIQQVEHRQEVPKYKKVYQLRSINPIEQKIFIIDEGAYATMLLAEEYWLKIIKWLFSDDRMNKPENP